MQAKVILIAAIATAIIVAVAVGYTSLFGASGNFKVLLSAASNTDAMGTSWAISHKAGVVKIHHLVGPAKSKRITQYNSADGNFNVFSTKEGEVPVHIGCTRSLASGISISEGSLNQRADGNFEFTSDGKVVLTILMVGGKPFSVEMDGETYRVDDYQFDQEIDLLTPNPDLPCDSKYHYPGGRRLGIEGTATPNASSKWLKLLFGSGSYQNAAFYFGGFTHVASVNEKYTYGGVSGNYQAVFMRGTDGWCGVSFSGTNDGADALVDLYAVTTPCFGVKCHTGFHDYYTLFKPFIIKNIGGCTKMHFMGHSLGGATAFIAAGYAKLTEDLGTKFDTVRVSTAGSPRPFAESQPYVGDAVRFVNRDDPIPSVPPATLGYYHGAGEVRTCDWDWFWGYYCQREGDSNWGTWFNPLFITSHLAPTYMEYFGQSANTMGGLWGL